MDLMYIVHRSLSSYIFVVPGVLLYFLKLKKKGKKQTGAHIIIAFVFCYYLICLLTTTYIGEIKRFSPSFVWIPFAEMINDPVHAALNVLLFMPLGFFLPVLYERYGKKRRIAFVGFLISLSVEFVQMFGHGATDINDLITNTVGACLGYCIYILISRLTQKKVCEKFKAIKINDCNEVLFFVTYSFLVMVIIKPIMDRILFRLG